MTHIRMTVGALAPSRHPRRHIGRAPDWHQATWAILVCFVPLGHAYESMFEELCFKAKKLEVTRLGVSQQAGGYGWRG